ncbi:argininosuccinate lyase [Hazenella sp. IB182357]|uniref:Argininosuccinate lyase n=1 Tax=Polycladospora coralii TaxID=2771432 RepID=A0A926RUG3_9BACL|nr:argininosuccinate lyase [Polycladospora coralii]MBD1372527.1 argininosuccinate lyase [Polycladospora coralii]MBS7531350.1 argininosuccinate lyase [Polycladospora coralii]
MKAWNGRFKKELNHLVEDFQASISYDHVLVAEDITGSIAHTKMLATCGIIPAQEADQIINGLYEVWTSIQNGEVTFQTQYEDIHMNIEALLTQRIGPVAGKLHTARSRNDQVALDMHLYTRKHTVTLVALILQLQSTLISLAEKYQTVIMPGYTHLQRAQPVPFAHHLLAYVAMLERDVERLVDSYKRTNTCPLGAGAIAGTTFPIDRNQVAQSLGFDRLYENSMDAVSDRDYLVELLANGSLIMVHLSRLAEELILWSSDEFKYITLDDAFCTGSSMMPQKKNPDIPELIRGKTGRVFGHLTALLTTLKALPLTYNKDLQEDKEGVFDTVSTLEQVLTILTPLLDTLEVHAEKMKQNAETGFLNATDLADYLVRKGIPFREAHAIVGKLVLDCIEKNRNLIDVPLNELQEACPQINADIYHDLSLEQMIETRTCEGGTAFEVRKNNIAHAKTRIQQWTDWVHEQHQG